MYLTYEEAISIRIYDLPSQLQTSIIKAACASIRHSSQRLWDRISKCKVCEAEQYVPDLYQKYIHILQ